MTQHHPSNAAQHETETPREIELKLAIPGGSADVLAEHLTALMPPPGQARRRHQVTTYFDTPDQILGRGGMSLRVRVDDGRRVQTFKARARNGVAADRAEWEWPIEQDAPDFRLIEQIPIVRDLPSRPVFEPVFSTEIDRTVRVLKLADGIVVEAAYDEGVISAGDVRQPVRELELELHAGKIAPLYRLAMELHAVVPLMFETESKAARGYRMKSGDGPAPRKAEDVPIEPTTSAAEAFRTILNAGLGHLLVNQPAALAGDAEGVHQMRIAIRRLRAALALFQPHLERHAAALFEAELRRVGRIFGEARDWDVFCLQILPDTLGPAQDGGWRDLLLKPAMAARAVAHDAFAAEVRGPAFTGLVLGLAAWGEETPLIDDAARKQPIGDLCPVLLDRLAGKVDRRGRHIGRRSDTERHALRKSLKKLRYGIDFVQKLFRPKPLGFYLHACKKLQQTLGDLNDSVTAIGLAERLAGGTRPDLAPAVGALAEQLDRQHDDALHDLAKRWKGFQSQPHVWK